MKNKKKSNRIWTVLFWLAVASVVLGCCMPANLGSLATATTKATDKEEKSKETTKNKNNSDSTTTKKDPGSDSGENTKTPSVNVEDRDWGDFTFEDFVSLFVDGDFSKVTPEFKETMDAYEAFYDEYLEFMKTYLSGEGSNYMDMLEDYLDLLERLEEWTEKIDAIDQSQLSDADDAYYLYITARVLDKQLAFLLDDDSGSQSSTDPSDRPQRTNDGDTYEAKYGVWSMTVPTYWEQNTDMDGFVAYAETGNCVAVIQISTLYDDVDPVGFYWLEDDEERAAVIRVYLDGMTASGALSDPKILNEEVVETNQLKGVMWTVKMNSSVGGGATMLFLCYPSEKDNSWVYVNCMYSDNTTYQYEQDFRNMIKSIKNVG